MVGKHWKVKSSYANIRSRKFIKYYLQYLFWNFISVADTERRFDNDVDIGSCLKVRKVVSYFRHDLLLSG
jgi:hypothetical protein